MKPRLRFGIVLGALLIVTVAWLWRIKRDHDAGDAIQALELPQLAYSAGSKYAWLDSNSVFYVARSYPTYEARVVNVDSKQDHIIADLNSLLTELIPEATASFLDWRVSLDRETILLLLARRANTSWAAASMEGKILASEPSRVLDHGVPFLAPDASLWLECSGSANGDLKLTLHPLGVSPREPRVIALPYGIPIGFVNGLSFLVVRETSNLTEAEILQARLGTGVEFVRDFRLRLPCQGRIVGGLVSPRGDRVLWQMEKPTSRWRFGGVAPYLRREILSDFIYLVSDTDGSHVQNFDALSRLAPFDSSPVWTLNGSHVTAMKSGRLLMVPLADAGVGP